MKRHHNWDSSCQSSEFVLWTSYFYISGLMSQVCSKCNQGKKTIDQTEKICLLILTLEMLTHSTMARFGWWKNHFKLEKKTEIHCQGYRKHGTEILYSAENIFGLAFLFDIQNCRLNNKNMFLHFLGKIWTQKIKWKRFFLLDIYKKNSWKSHYKFFLFVNQPSKNMQ